LNDVDSTRWIVVTRLARLAVRSSKLVGRDMDFQLT